jgi:predicted double-glycine peptidase
MKALRMGVVGLGWALLAGCASVSSFRGMTLAENNLYVSGVPPVRQDGRYSCGPACLAAVAAYWGTDLGRFRTAGPATLAAETNGAQLRALAETLGLQAYVYRGSLDDSERNLRQGRPLIVMIPRPANPQGFPGGLLGEFTRLISERLPRPSHWVTLTGYGENGDAIVMDPASGPLRIRREKFLADWKSLDNTCVLMVARSADGGSFSDAGK